MKPEGCVVCGGIHPPDYDCAADHEQVLDLEPAQARMFDEEFE